MINSSLPEVIRDPENLENRGRVMLGSMEAGFAFSNAILGAVHALAHSLGGFLDLPHGECNAILLPYVVRKNFDYAADRYRVIAENMGLDTAGHADGYVCDLLVDHIEKLKHEVGLVRTLKDFGMTADKMDFVTENALNDACMVTNPVNLTIEDVVKIYEAAL
jgi:alcohol dehydrogenase class IV